MADLITPVGSKLGNITLCCGAWGFRAFEFPLYFAAAAELGFKHVELQITRVVGSRCHLGPVPSEKELAARRKASADAGVEISVVAGTNDFTINDETKLQAEIEFARRQVDGAAALGASILRLFSGWTRYEDLSDESYQRAGAAICKVGEYAASSGVAVAIENHGGMTGTAAQVRRLLDMAPLSNVGHNFDPANFARCYEDPLAAYSILRDRIIYVQLKDIRWRDGVAEYCAIGEGVIGWLKILPALAETYHGYWGVEYEDAADIMEGTRRSLEKLSWFDKRS